MKEHWKRFAMPLVLIFILPLAVNLAACMMLSSHQIGEIPMGVYLGDNSSLSRTIIEEFDKSQHFQLILFASSPAELESSLNRGDIAFGLIIPDDFYKQIKGNESPSIMTLVDGTRLSIASFAKVASSEILLGVKNELLVEKLNVTDGMTLDEAETLAKSISFETRLLHNPTKDYLAFLMPGLMTSLVQVGIALSAAATEWMGGCPRNRKEILLKAGAYALAGTVSITMILVVQTIGFSVPLKGSAMIVLLLTSVFTFAVASMALMISAGLSDKVLACQIAAVYFIPSTILSGYSWPISSMPEPYHYLAPLLPFTHYGATLRDILLKGSTDGLLQDLMILTVFSLIGIMGASSCAHFREFVKRRFAASIIGQRILKSLELKEEQ